MATGRAGLLVVLLIVAAGCDNMKRSLDQLAEAALDHRVPAPAADESFPADEYVVLGLPDPARDWSAADLDEAREALEQVASEKVEHLPRFESPRSGVVFARLVSPDNLQPFFDRTLSLDDRLEPSVEYLKAQNQILGLYMNSFPHNAGDEIVELIDAQIASTRAMTQVVGELVKTFDKDDPTYADRAAGLGKLRGSLSKEIEGALTMLEERQEYRRGALLRHLKNLQREIPEVIPYLTTAARFDVVSRLKKLQEDRAVGDLRPEIAVLSHRVDEAINVAPEILETDSR